MQTLHHISETPWIQKVRMSALLMAMGHSVVAAVGFAFLSKSN